MGVVGVTQHTEHVAQLVMTLACSSMGMAAGVASRGSLHAVGKLQAGGLAVALRPVRPSRGCRGSGGRSCRSLSCSRGRAR